MTQALLSGLAVGSAYALMSLGFALDLEICDIVNAAHGAFVVLGMYLMLELAGLGWPVPAAIAAATAGVALLAFPVYVLLVGPARATAGHRIQLVYTLLLLIASPAVFQIFFGGDILTVAHHFASVPIAGGTLSTIEIASIAAAVLLTSGLSLAAKRTVPGKLAYCAGRYQLGARAIGLSITRVYTLVFVMAGALAGLAGGLIVSFQPVSPTLGLGFVSVVFLVVIVGRATLTGCLVLGFGYGVAQALLNYFAPAAIAATLTYLVFLAALVVAQQGASRRVTA
jgi:branched-chain amino acid transport system permease protein